MDLFRSSKPLYRSKIMLVGFEKVGKTSLKGCLFPLETKARISSFWLSFWKSESIIVLSGPVLEIFQGNKKEFFLLNNQEWKVSWNPEKLNLILSSLNKNLSYIIAFPNPGTFSIWKERIDTISNDTRTHGIDIEWHSLSREEFKHLTSALDISIWDFAGQHDYYNQHHLFLQLRTVFLVAFKLGRDSREEEKQMRGLHFWLNTLKHKLFRQDGSNKRNFSIFLVATHADQKVNAKAFFQKRREQAIKEARTILGTDGLDLHYFEVSCIQGSNLPESPLKDLETQIYQSIANHSYMGEIVPQSYLDIQSGVMSLRKKKGGFLVAELKEVVEAAEEERKKRRPGAQFFPIPISLARRALMLLASWGICCYFEDPELENLVVVLDPTFLTKDTLANLFAPDIVKDFEDQYLKVKDLPSKFNKPLETLTDTSLQTLVSLFEKLELCFILEERNLPYEEKRIIFTAHLPERKPEGGIFEDDPEQKKVVQFFVFDVMPSWLFGRLLCRLHQQLGNGIVWKKGLSFRKGSALRILGEAFFWG